MYGISGTLVASHGSGDELESYLLDAAQALQGVEACRLYLVSRVAEEPDMVHITEVWDDAAAHEASLQLDAVQQLVSRARPILAGSGERLELLPVGGKGLAHRT